MIEVIIGIMYSSAIILLAFDIIDLQKRIEKLEKTSRRN